MNFDTDEFSWNLIFEYFPKISQKISSLIKSDNNNGNLNKRLMWICDNISLISSENKMSQTKVAEEI